MKAVYIDKLNNIVNKYINTDHSTIQMKPVDVNDNIYIDFGKDRNDKDSKFQVDDHVKISKYKNIFAKCYTPKVILKMTVLKLFSFSANQQIS